jgi:hypothetical protein
VCLSRGERQAHRPAKEYREFRVWAMTMREKETSYGTTQTARYS